MTAASELYREISADARLNDSYIFAAKSLAAELVRYRSHIVTLFTKDFRASFNGTVLGRFWNFTLPIIPVLVYAGLAALRVFPDFEGMPAALAISLNATLWFLFVDCVRTPIQIVETRNATAMKTSLPLSAAIASGFGRAAFEALIRLGLVALVALILLRAPSPWSVGLPLIIAAGCILFLAVGLILSILNVVVPDIQKVTTLALQYGIFLSGVIFPLHAAGKLSVLQYVNPFAVFVHAGTELALKGQLTYPGTLAFWTLAGLLAMLIAIRLFHATEQRIRGIA